MTPTDLRVPLASLFGFDPMGLPVLVVIAAGRTFDKAAEEHHVLFALDDVRCFLGDRHGYVALRLREQVLLDLADGATRDRVARWLAERVGLAVGSTAPGWTHCSGLHLWRLGGSDYDDPAFYASGQKNDAWRGDAVVAPLADLDLSDDTRLHDGSRLVDAVALARVAVHIGGTS